MNKKATGDEWIWGLHSVEACTDVSPELILEIFIERGAEKRFEKTVHSWKSSGLRVSEVDRLPKFLAERRTQGIAAKIKDFPVVGLEDFLGTFAKNIGPTQGIIIDRIQDAQNFGAILRSAAALGASFVIFGMREQCPVSGVVAQVSAGNLFRVKLVQTYNPAKAALLLKEKGFRIAGLESDGLPLMQALKENADKVVWVLGAEEDGIQASLQKALDLRVGIPMKAGVESLNVSNSAAIALFAWKHLIGP